MTDTAPLDALSALAATIRARRLEAPDASAPSYTRALLDAGPERCARKFGEEAVELIVAALARPSDNGRPGPGTGAATGVPKTEAVATDDEHLKQALTSEAADVLYHLLVLLESRDVAWQDVAETLACRAAMSGIEEKAGRSRAAPSAPSLIV